MPPSLIPGIFSKRTSPLNLHFCLLSFLFEARGLAGLWIGKDENTAVGGPCLAHKPWPENRLWQVGTGSSIFPLIKWRSSADTFLQEPGGVEGGASWEHLVLCRAASPTWCRTVLFLCKTRCSLIVPAPWVLLLMCSLAFSSFSRNQRKCLSVVPVLGDFWRCHVMSLCLRVLFCTACYGPAFSWGKAFPRPPTKISLPLV